MSANGKYYLAMSVRMRLPDNSRKYFVGRLTLAKTRIFWDWAISEKPSIATSDELAESTVCKYSVAAFQDKCMLKDVKRAFGEYYKRERGKSKDALLQFFLETLELRKERYNLPSGSVCDWAQEIMGTVIFNRQKGEK